MRRLKLAVIAMFALVTVSSVNAQDANNPWVVGFGINTVDVRTMDKDFGIILQDMIGTEEWESNTIPSISRISVDKYLNKGFSLQVAGSLNKIGYYSASGDADALYYAIDAVVKYDLNHVFGQTGWFDPYLGIGGSYQNLDHTNAAGQDGTEDGMLTGVIGFNTWFNDNIGLNFQTGYKHNFEENGFDVFQHSLGLVIKFGGKDSDGDGIYDKNDACPEVAGLKEFNGCPDADGDGIKDSDDACPNVAGLAAMNGCPDSDEDGIADADDMCPNEKGTKANKGCPDADGDGVVDKDDKCINVAGPAANGGCPWADTDKDGVLDKDDKCIDEAGPASNNGCPSITKEGKMQLDIFAKAIYFNTSRATFKPGITNTLNEMVKVINKYPTATFIVKGHTDSVGRDSFNQTLSQKRADAVMNYFIANGVSASKISAQGYGETMPKDSNKTKEGRANNRRVEIQARD